MTPNRALVLGLLLSLGGCAATTNPDSPGTELEFFEDLPAAEGMNYDKGYGHKTPSGGLRSYTQEYSGRRKLEDVKKFYEKALPVHGWTLKSTEGTDPVTMVFEKRMEKAILRIHDDRGLLRVHVRVTGK